MDAANQEAKPDAGAGGKRLLTTNVKVLLVVTLLLTVGGWFGWRAYHEAYVRVKFVEVLGEGSDLQARTAEEFAGPSGADHEVAPHTRYVRRILVSRANRTIVMWLDPRTFDEPGVEDGANVRFTFASDGSSWACRASGMPKGLVPVACRG